MIGHNAKDLILEMCTIHFNLFLLLYAIVILEILLACICYSILDTIVSFMKLGL